MRSSTTSPGTRSRAGTTVSSAVAKHACHGAAIFSQRFERAARTMFLNETEQHRKQDDDGDDDGLERVTEESRYGCRREQNQNQHVLELGGEGAPRGRTRSAPAARSARRRGRRCAASALARPVRPAPSVRARLRPTGYARPQLVRRSSALRDPASGDRTHRQVESPAATDELTVNAAPHDRRPSQDHDAGVPPQPLRQDPTSNPVAPMRPPFGVRREPHDDSEADVSFTNR